MTNLLPVIELANGVPVTTSLEVANFFEKQHKHVLEKIETITKQLEPNFREPNFRLSVYKPQNGLIEKELPMYYLTRDGFTLLAMGFTGEKALKFKLAYIEAFNRMEAQLKKKQNPKPILANMRDRIPLSDAVDIWVKKSVFTHAQAWKMISAHFGISEISYLPLENLPDAIDFVKEQIKKMPAKYRLPRETKEKAVALSNKINSIGKVQAAILAKFFTNHEVVKQNDLQDEIKKETLEIELLVELLCACKNNDNGINLNFAATEALFTKMKSVLRTLYHVQSEIGC